MCSRNIAILPMTIMLGAKSVRTCCSRRRRQGSCGTASADRSAAEQRRVPRLRGPAAGPTDRRRCPLVAHPGRRQGAEQGGLPMAATCQVTMGQLDWATIICISAAARAMLRVEWTCMSTHPMIHDPQHMIASGWCSSVIIILGCEVANLWTRATSRLH